jgi:soluble lytic murein transglycosylase-like protein
VAIQVQSNVNRTVETARAPNEFQSDAGAMPEAFGALEGRALAGAGNALQGVGNELAATAFRQREEDEARGVLDANNKLQDASRRFKFGEDGNGGVLARQGEAAIGITKDTQAFYAEQVKTLGSELKSPKAKLQFDRVVSQQRDADLDATARREADNRLKAGADVAKATVERATQNAIDAANDDKVAQASMNVGLAAIRSNIAGSPKEVVDAAAEAFKSDLQTKRIERIAVDSPAKAEEMYGRLKGDIRGADHVKVERLLRPLQDRRDGLAVAAEYTGSPGPAVQRLGEAATAPQPVRVSGANLPALVTSTASAESNFRPGAVSPKGAAGIFQVMPETAREISAKLGDGLIGPNTSQAEIKRILADRDTGLRYGTSYLRDQLVRFGGDIPAALVAYNAGPARAEEWLKVRKSPNDLSSLPKETRDYVPKVMTRYADLDGGSPDVIGGEPDAYSLVRMGALPKAGERMTRQNWSLKFYKAGDMLPPSGDVAVDARAAVMADTLGSRFFEATGIRVPINDDREGPGTHGKRRGVRDPHDNPGAKGSQHLHGRAFDFQVQALDEGQKALFLKMARKTGFSGVGFYDDGPGHLHLDTGRARSWGTQPKWAGGAMGIPALGQSDMAVPATVGGLPVPASMRAGAGGRETAALRAVAARPAGTGTSFLPPALTPEARDLIGTPAPTVSSVAAGASFGVVPPAVSSALRLGDDFDPQAWRDAVANDPRLDTPTKLSSAKAAVEREIRAREGSRKSATRELRNEGIRHVQAGGSADDLKPEIYSALVELDPKFVTDTLPAMEERIRKRKDTTDETVMYGLSQMSKDELADLDLTNYAHRLSRSDFEKFADRQNAARSGRAADALKWEGIDTQKAIATNALTAAGIVVDKDKPETAARAGLFMQRLETRVAAFSAENKRVMKPAELSETIANLLTPLNQGDYTGKMKYLFEAGTPEENDFRRRNSLPLPDVGRTFQPARKLEEVPQASLQTLVDNHATLRGTTPNAAQSMQYFNDYTALSVGRDIEPSVADRREIIEGLRKKFGPGIQNDAGRREELEAKVRDVYARTLRVLLTPKPAAAPASPAIPF